jgi:lysyl-tRNA synthetase class I
LKIIRKEEKRMREFLKDLRKNTNEKLIEKLNYNQQWYNKYFDLMYKYDVRDAGTRYSLDLYLTNMNKIKKVFEERNITIEFVNGWEVVEEK